MTKQTRIIFFGNERLSSSNTPSQTPLLRGLIEADYDIAAVYVSNKPVRSRKQRSLEVAEVAAEHGIPVIYVQKLKDHIQELTEHNADLAVLAAFGKIIPQSIIDIFPGGILNIHPSDLPEFRGPTPIESTILSGQNQTAVSVMQLDAGMDTGAVYARAPVSLTGHESKSELTLHLAEVGAQTLLEILPNILDGSILPLEQDQSQANYTELMDKQTGQIDWSKPAEHLAREVRAYADWPTSRTELAGMSVQILDAKVIDANGQPGEHFKTEDKKLAVYCGEQALQITTIKPANKQPMDGVSFLNGYL